MARSGKWRPLPLAPIGPYRVLGWIVTSHILGPQACSTSPRWATESIT